VPDPDDTVGPVDVAPAECEQLAAPHSRESGGEVQRALEVSELVVGDGADDRFDLFGA